MRRSSIHAVIAALAVVVATAVPAAAQQHIRVLTEPGTPVVAVEVMVVAGPADEEEGQAGLANLSARAVTAPILSALDSLGAHLSVTAYKDAIGFSLIAAPDAWEEASRTLLVALFRDPPRGNAVLRARDAIVAELTARAEDPADAAERASDAAFFGDAHPWGRSTVGSPETVRRLTLEDVNTFLRNHFTSDRAVAAVVGPVDPEGARSHLARYLNPTGPLPFTPVPAQPADSAVWREFDAITTWTVVSYPFPPEADLEALRFLARLVSDEISFSPSRDAVFNARTDIFPLPGGGELRFQVVTPPERARRGLASIREAVEEAAEGTKLKERFPALLRRYRGERLLALAAPENRARELARRLILASRGVDVIPAIDGLTLERLQAAARSLGTPTVVFLGPFLDDSTSTGNR